MIFYYNLTDLEKTKKIATVISQLAQPNLLLLLNGTLGAGKTQLTKFIGQNLLISEPIVSPTFVILNQYTIPKQNFQLIHMDAYRLNSESSFHEYYELMLNNFVIIEWSNNIKYDFLNFKIIKINFLNEKRDIMIKTQGLSQSEVELINRKIIKEY